MANTVKQRTLVDGPTRTIRHVYIYGDGTGEESDLKIFDASAFTVGPQKATISKVSLMRLWWNINAAAAILEWDADTDVPFFSLNPNANGFVDFRSFGGIPEIASTGATNDINLTSVGLSANDTITLTFEVKQS